MKLQLYEITKCGFYESYDDEGPARFGHLSDWWGEFSSWAGGKDYKQTGTFNDTHEPHTVYCIVRANDGNGNYGVALWNVSPGLNGRAFHLPPSGLVDSIQAAAAPVEEGSTAGWPTYFWIMPGENVIAALIPNGFRGSGIPHARKYFYEYLKTRSGYRRENECFNDYGHDKPLPLLPKFETSSLKRAGQVEEIADRWREINKYVTNTSFEPPHQGQDSQLQQGIRSLIPRAVGSYHDESRGRKKERAFRLEADWKPDSREAVVDLIGSWDDRVMDDNNWAGVRLKDGRLYRFDEMECREPVELAAELDVNPNWDRDTMMSIWEEARVAAQSLLSQARRTPDQQA